MTRQIEFADNEYYHIFNRGTEKRNIFRHNRDRDRFLAGLYAANATARIHVSDCQGSTLTSVLHKDRGDTLVDICAYCLMPNHFHLLLREKRAGGVSLFMQKLLTGYTMYFNLINKRSGALFQGKYKANHADNDRYLKYLISYIHLNPVSLHDPEWKQTGIKNYGSAELYLNGYEFSSYLDYNGVSRPQGAILERAALPQYFSTPDELRKCTMECLRFPRKLSRSNLDNF